MAFADLSNLKPPMRTKRVPLSTLNNAREVRLPTWCRYVTVRFWQSNNTATDSGKIASDGTDDSAIGDDVLRVDDGVTYTNIPVKEDETLAAEPPKLYLCGGTASGYAELMLQMDKT